MKNIRTLKIVHMCLAVAAIILTFISIVEAIVHPKADSSNTLTVVLALLRELTLFTSSVYLIFGYKKEVAGFYKATMISAILTLLVRFVNGGNTLLLVLNLVSLVSLVALSFVKDLGKWNTSIIYGVLFVSELVIALLTFNNDPIGALSSLIILGSLGIMITGKYSDKFARGSH